MNDVDLAGMTVNERLFALGTLADFDAAVAAGRTDNVENILQRANVDRLSIDRIVRGLGGASGRTRTSRAAHG